MSERKHYKISLAKYIKQINSLPKPKSNYKPYQDNNIDYFLQPSEGSLRKYKPTKTEIKSGLDILKIRKDKKSSDKRDKHLKHIIHQKAVARLKKMPYYEFLQTPYWANVRLKVMKRDGYKCVVCGSTKFLQVHHDSYRHHGDELNHLEDLLTLCKDCHKEHHYAQN